MTSRFYSAGILVSLLLLTFGCGTEKVPPKKVGNIAQLEKDIKKEEDPEKRAKLQVSLANAKKAAADGAGAESALIAAVDSADQVEDPKGKANVLIQIADAQAKLELKTEAKNVLKKVQPALDKITDIESKLPVMCRLAGVYSQIGNKDAATANLKTCEELAAGIEAIHVKIGSLLDVAVAYTKIDAASESKRLVDLCFELARGAEDKLKRSVALSEIGGKLGAMKKTDEAKAAFEEAEKSIAEIETDDGRANAMVTLAEKQISAGFKGTASETLKKAVGFAAKAKDQSLIGPLNDKIEQLKGKL